jgi:hypothetical protein
LATRRGDIPPASIPVLPEIFDGRLASGGSTGRRT